MVRLRWWRRSGRGGEAPVEKLLVGLGNPGPEYADTRHNVGVRVAETVARTHGFSMDQRRFHSRYGAGPIEGCGQVAVLAPQTYMNRSATAVAAAVRGLGLDHLERNVLLVFDDVDLPFGRLRVRPGGGAGGHRGLGDVIEGLGTKEIPRLRVGVGRPPDGGDTAGHVLEPFGPDELAELPELLERAAGAVVTALGAGVVAAMNEFNSG